MDKKQTWDFVVYDAQTKEIITIVSDLKEDPKFIINTNYVGVYIPSDEYLIDDFDGKGYFHSLQNVVYLDEYRGRYID